MFHAPWGYASPVRKTTGDAGALSCVSRLAQIPNSGAKKRTVTTPPPRLIFRAFSSHTRLACRHCTLTGCHTRLSLGFDVPRSPAASIGARYRSFSMHFARYRSRLVQDRIKEKVNQLTAKVEAAETRAEEAEAENKKVSESGAQRSECMARAPRGERER